METSQLTSSSNLLDLANIVAVDMHNAFMLAFCMRLTTKLQVFVVVTFLKLAQLRVHRLSELVCVSEESLATLYKVIKIVVNDDMDLERHRKVKVCLKLFKHCINVTNYGFQQIKVENFHVDAYIKLAKVVQMLYEELKFWFSNRNHF